MNVRTWNLQFPPSVHNCPTLHCTQLVYYLNLKLQLTTQDTSTKRHCTAVHLNSWSKSRIIGCSEAWHFYALQWRDTGFLQCIAMQSQSLLCTTMQGFLCTLQRQRQRPDYSLRILFKHCCQMFKTFKTKGTSETISEVAMVDETLSLVIRSVLNLLFQSDEFHSFDWMFSVALQYNSSTCFSPVCL